MTKDECRIDIVKKLCKSSAFYRAYPTAFTLRIEYSDDNDSFHCIDEDSGEEYNIDYASVIKGAVFFKLVEEEVIV